MHDYYKLIISVSHMFRKGAGRKRGENFLIKQREKFCQHIQIFHLRAVFYGLLQGFLPSLVLQGLWIPKESFGEAFSNVQQRFQEKSFRVETSTLGFLTHFCWNIVSR